VTASRTPAEKATQLVATEIKSTEQAGQLGNPDARIILEDLDENAELLEKIADSGGGASTFDSPRFIFTYWEHPEIDLEVYYPNQSSPTSGALFTGRSFILKWQKGKGELFQLMEDKKKLENYSSGIWIVWSRFVGRKGVLLSMISLDCTLYDGFAFDNNTGVVIPNSEAD
jgi:hypothetical protein